MAWIAARYLLVTARLRAGRPGWGIGRDQYRRGMRETRPARRLDRRAIGFVISEAIGLWAAIPGRLDDPFGDDKEMIPGSAYCARSGPFMGSSSRTGTLFQPRRGAARLLWPLLRRDSCARHCGHRRRG